MNLHNSIRCEYGQDTVKLVRDYENTSKRLARFRNHLRFNLHCRHNGVTPVSLRLRTNVRGNAADNIIKRAERSLLGVRIGQTVRNVDILDKKVVELREKVNRKLSPKMREAVVRHVSDAHAWEHKEVKERQEKFEGFWIKS